MRIDQIRLALQEEIPFEIATAAGDKFRVEDRENLAIREQSGAVSLITEDGLVHVIPLLIMTSLTYLRKNPSKRRKR